METTFESVDSVDDNFGFDFCTDESSSSSSSADQQVSSSKSSDIERANNVVFSTVCDFSRNLVEFFRTPEFLELVIAYASRLVDGGRYGMYYNFADIPEYMRNKFYQHYPNEIQDLLHQDILYIKDCRTYFKDSEQKDPNHRDWFMDNLVCRSITGLGINKGLLIQNVALYSYDTDTMLHFIGGIKGDHKAYGIGNSHIIDLRIHYEHISSIESVKEIMMRDLPSKSVSTTASGLGYVDHELLVHTLNDNFKPNKDAKLTFLLNRSMHGSQLLKHRQSCNLTVYQTGLTDRSKWPYQSSGLPADGGKALASYQKANKEARDAGEPIPYESSGFAADRGGGKALVSYQQANKEARDAGEPIPYQSSGLPADKGNATAYYQQANNEARDAGEPIPYPSAGFVADRATKGKTQFLHYYI